VIVTGDEAGTIKIWIPSSASSAQTTEQQSTADGPTPEFVVAQSVEAHGASVSALGQCSISDTEALILSGGSDAVVHVWRWSHTVSDAGGTSESPTLIRHDCESFADLTLSLLHVELVKVQTLDLGGRLPLDMALHKLPDSDGMSPFVPDNSRNNLTCPSSVHILALATTERKIHIYTTSSTNAQKSDLFQRSLALEGHEDWIRSLDFAVFPKLSDAEHDSPAATTDVEGDDLMLASGSQDGYIRLWKVTELSQASASAISVDASERKTEENDQLDDDMLDEFERQMTGETGGTARGGKQLSTKAHVITLDSSSDTGSSAAPRQYGINLEALLIGHEGWVTNVHWSPSLSSTSLNISTPRLLSTAADNSMIIWAPELRTAVWLAQHRFGEMNAKGLGLFGALWTVDGESASADGNTASLSVIANAWNGGFQRWSAEVERNSAEQQEAEKWESEVAPTGHGLAVKDLAWDPAHEYLVSVRLVSHATSRR
jgi:elongator complex protein 2